MGAFFRFRLDQFVTQTVRKPRYDLILQLEQVGDVLVEAVGPEMRAGLGVDALRRGLHGTVQHPGTWRHGSVVAGRHDHGRRHVQ